MISHVGIVTIIILISKLISPSRKRKFYRTLAFVYAVLGFIPPFAWLLGGFACHRINLDLRERGCASERHTPRYAVLTILTLGLYQSYWWYVTTEDVNRCLRRE
ncbi:DUF4234 domain-containing protein [Methanopyrus kandleri]|uniref:Uncharacterized membrane protein specific for M.kandleri, MK-4 family n=2 Tax=Methanopyrus kandleri TaxID=2320 RepID=Q8TWT6_METKA|nr:DUF4234 domain-containing protein [Methanopyrus kandleri]AAM02159.1 Uncharacterized membrane protein specific for M.kandleri, MK-4 family [Methanopyrus kandleri AV19]HII69822.1 DUF4234 domain-containing protein [Methanopyrus kandleri]